MAQGYVGNMRKQRVLIADSNKKLYLGLVMIKFPYLPKYMALC